ncbi:hypothetical protein ACLNGM_20190 [Aureimonas phyllosphaerae]|uniref:hypothetical protein n=1 Tax=Aureimonas phyllosphaerae TaxID=1166078 RepID=UPI003A5C06B8
MANYLDAHPADRPMLDWHRADPFGLVPIVRKGEFAALVNPRSLARYTPPVPISAEDYVVGLEVLGFRFAVDQRPGGPAGILTIFPADGLPPNWRAMSITIMSAFDAQERHDELAAFLLARDGVPS